MAVFITNRNVQHGVDSRGYCLANTFASDSLSKKAFVFGLSLTCSTRPSRFAFLLTLLVRLLTLSQRWNVESFWKTFLRSLPFCVCVVRYVQAKFIMYHPVTWCYVLQHWWLLRPKSQTHCKCWGLLLRLLTLNDTVTLSRIRLDEWLDCRRGLYLKRCDINKRQTSRLQWYSNPQSQQANDRRPTL